MRARLHALTGGTAAWPLAVLFAFNLVDEFDRVAFAALTPEIRDAFGLSDTGIAAVGVSAAVLVLLSAVPVGFVADRVPRVRTALAAAVVWATASLFTGLVRGLALLVVVRLLSGAGRVVNDVVHPSLLGDWYPPGRHPAVFTVHRLANPLGALAGVLAGGIAAAAGWRWAFVALALPVFCMLPALAALREPRRGESVDAVLAAQAASEDPIPFDEARRRLYAVRTLRRIWIGAFLLGLGAVPVNQLLSLFFEDVYGLGPLGRGGVQFLQGAGTVVGLVVGGRLASRASREQREGRLATITGASLAWLGGGAILMAVMPWTVASAAFVVVLSMGLGAAQPAYLPLVGRVAPPRVRSQAYAWTILHLGAGGLASLPLFRLGEAYGYRVTVVVLACAIAIAGAVAASAARFVDGDIEQALETLATAVRVREALEPGRDRLLLVCRRVDAGYGSVQVLFGVDLELREGEIVAVLGTNGAGKSTLLRAIAGTIDPVGGAIFFDGRDITHADAEQTARLGVVQVHGGRGVFPTLTVAEHFRACSWLFDAAERRTSGRDHERDVADVLARFPVLRERWDQLAGNLSGGEQQMLALAMAFVASPRLLVIDELSLGLAPSVVERLLEMVREINRRGASVLVVEQSVTVALRIASRAYFLEKGEVRFEGRTSRLLRRPDLLRSVFLSRAASLEPATHGGRDGTSNGGRPALEVDGLTLQFGGVTALAGVSLALRRGRITGVIGPNGAGKTTLLDVVSGVVRADCGRVVLDGRDVSAWPPERRALAGLGRSFQDSRLFGSLTVAENLAVALERHVAVRDHVAAALALPAIAESEDDVAWTVDDLLELLGLSAFRTRYVAELSTGTRRILDLAMALAHEPTVLLLDEPSAGIAQRETEALGPLLLRVRDETGCAMLVVEHHMPLVTSVADELVAMHLGEVVAAGKPGGVLADPVVVESYLGEAEPSRSRPAAGGRARRAGRR